MFLVKGRRWLTSTKIWLFPDIYASNVVKKKVLSLPFSKPRVCYPEGPSLVFQSLNYTGLTIIKNHLNHKHAYTRKFVYSHSKKRAKLKENCWLWEPDAGIHKDDYLYKFLEPNGGYFIYYPSKHKTALWETFFAE